MKRGFIAAPLLATIIFLVVVLIIINTSRGESAAVASVVNDAYNNRIVSLLEVYRNDLSSLFREGLKTNIEEWLSGQCWTEFTISNDKLILGLSSVPEEISEQDLRFEKCTSLNNLIHNVVCSYAGAKISKEASNEKVVFAGGANTYGLQKWLAYIGNTIFFEGIRYAPQNPKDLTKVFSDPKEYIEFCNSIIKEVTFDCHAFAYGKKGGNFQCCSKPTTKDKFCGKEELGGNGGEVIEGCEEGNFYINISVTDPDVFPRMPRIIAEDGLGNQIVSGALADKDFLLPINYRVFKYYDDAFKFFRYLAYGVGPHPEQNPDPNVCNDAPPFSEREGVVDGLWLGPPGQAPDNFMCFIKPAGGLPNADERLKELFFTHAYGKACAEFTKSGESLYSIPYPPIQDSSTGVSTQKCISGTCPPYYENNPEFVSCGSQEAFDKNFPDPDTSVSPPSAYYVKPALVLRFVDNDSRFRAKREQPNLFCWTAAPYHAPPP